MHRYSKVQVLKSRMLTQSIGLRTGLPFADFFIATLSSTYPFDLIFFVFVNPLKNYAVNVNFSVIYAEPLKETNSINGL